MRGDQRPSTGPVLSSSKGSGGGARGAEGDWPRDFGRDGVSGLVSTDRAMRARDVSRPHPADHQEAEAAVERLLSRANGRR